ncbi:MAG: hypothetical protein JWQ25_2273 [Daejeonella sp.]|nr:hypothetical protein [Daejeonella sp.]
MLANSANFNWRTTRDITFSIEISDTRFANELHVVSIYTADPENGGELIAQGAGCLTSKFETRIDLENNLHEVFVVKSAPDGSKISQNVPINTNKVSLVIGSVGISAGLLDVSKNKVIASKTTTTLAVSPNCNTGCDFQKTLTQNDEWLSVGNGSTLCVSGSNKSFNLNINAGGGTLRICGTGITLKNLNDNSNGAAIKIIVTSSGVVTLPNFNFNSANNTFENYGTVTFTENLALPGKLYNYGTLNVTKDYNINSLNNTVSTHFNEGVITVGGQMNINSNTILTNSKSITTEYLNVNNQGTLNNNCKLIVNQNFINDYRVNNFNYMKVGNTSKINGTAILKLADGSIFQTQVMDALGGTIVGTGTTSLVKVIGSTNNNIILNAKQTTDPKVKGAIEYCDNVSLPVSLFADGAMQGCDVYIVKNDCNNQTGNGTPPVDNPDGDGDGVADCNDNYPNDPSKAFNNYSTNYNGGGTTTAFEDKWPIKGDYDMNDVVITSRYLVVTNSINKVVQIKADYKLLATGGEFTNGAGIQFHIPNGGASNLVATAGVNFEGGQDSLVLVLFTNSKAEQSQWNTIIGQPLAAPKSYTASFTVLNGPSIHNFGVGSYNLFIWNNTLPNFGRGYETHLRDKSPTKLATTALFNTGDDRSNNGVRYVTANNLPWGIELPIANFAYPKEGASMVDTYLKFNSWATSNGTLYTDWYSNQAVGFRNTNNLFQ